MSVYVRSYYHGVTMRRWNHNEDVKVTIPHHTPFHYLILLILQHTPRSLAPLHLTNFELHSLFAERLDCVTLLFVEILKPVRVLRVFELANVASDSFDIAEKQVISERG